MSIVDLQCWVSFRCTTKWISCAYAYAHSHLDPFPMQAITGHWVEFPVLCSRSFVVQLLNLVRLVAPPCMDYSSPGSSVLQCLLDFAQIHVYWAGDGVMVSNHLILCHLFFLLHPNFPSFRIFSSESALCIRWPETCWSFSVSPSKEIQGWSPLGSTGPGNSPKSSLAPQFQSVSSSVLSLSYGPTLPFMCHHWRNRTFDWR